MRGRAHWLMTSWALALAGVACNALTGASDLDPSGLAPADDEDASVTSPPLDGGTFDRGSPRVDAASGRDADTGADAPVDAFAE